MIERDAAAVGRDSRAVIAPALLHQDPHLSVPAHPDQVALGARDVRHGSILRYGELGDPIPLTRTSLAISTCAPVTRLDRRSKERAAMTLSGRTYTRYPIV